MANVRNLFATEITVDEDDLHSIIDERIRHFSANLLQPAKTNEDEIKKIVADLLNKSHLRMVAIEAGETVQPRSHVPITRVSNKLTDEEKAKKGLDNMPNAVKVNYWNLIHDDNRPMKYNPLYEIGVQSGKIPNGAKFVTDIRQYALEIGFAPSDLEGSRLDLYYGRIVHGRWEEGSTLQSLKVTCNEYSKRFYKIYGADPKPTPKQIFGIE